MGRPNYPCIQLPSPYSKYVDHKPKGPIDPYDIDYFILPDENIPCPPHSSTVYKLNLPIKNLSNSFLKVSDIIISSIGCEPFFIELSGIDKDYFEISDSGLYFNYAIASKKNYFVDIVTKNLFGDTVDTDRFNLYIDTICTSTSTSTSTTQEPTTTTTTTVIVILPPEQIVADTNCSSITVSFYDNNPYQYFTLYSIEYYYYGTNLPSSEQRENAKSLQWTATNPFLHVIDPQTGYREFKIFNIINVLQLQDGFYDFRVKTIFRQNQFDDGIMSQFGYSIDLLLINCVTTPPPLCPPEYINYLNDNLDEELLLRDINDQFQYVIAGNRYIENNTMFSDPAIYKLDCSVAGNTKTLVDNENNPVFITKYSDPSLGYSVMVSGGILVDPPLAVYIDGDVVIPYDFVPLGESLAVSLLGEQSEIVDIIVNNENTIFYLKCLDLNCPTTTTSTTSTSTTQEPNCCDWDGNGTISFGSDCANRNATAIFTKTGDNTWSINGTLGCGDAIIGSISCNPLSSTSPCGGKWSASLNISCVENFILNAPDESCGCDQPPYWTFTGDASECGCCQCDEPQYECSSCRPSSLEPVINDQCIEIFGHSCWEDGLYIYRCHSDCLAAHPIDCPP